MRFFTSCCKVRCLRLGVGGSEAPAASLLTARLRGVYLRILWTFSTHSGPRTNPDNAGESKCKGQDTAGTGRPAGGQWYYRPINSVRLYHSWLHISIRRPHRNPSSGPVRLDIHFSHLTCSLLLHLSLSCVTASVTHITSSSLHLDEVHAT